MSTKVINYLRNVNAKLVNADISAYGATFAIQPPYNADGFSMVNISVEQVPNNIKNYLEGNTALTIYAVPINVDKLCKGALESFPNITDLYLFSLTMVDIAQEDDNEYLSYLTNLDTIYVPQDLLAQYQATYPNLTFNEINVDYSYTIEQPSAGVDTLTNEIITNDLNNNLTLGQRNAITKLIISSDFINNVDNVVWSYNFATLLPNLNNNIWYNNVKYDFTQRTLSGNDELLESDIANFVNGISSDKVNGVTQLHFEGFSDMSVALTYDYSALPNLAYIWLDNVRYESIPSPSGYQLVEYIESTGTQYISLPFNNLTRWEMNVAFTKTSPYPIMVNGATAGSGGFNITGRFAYGLYTSNKIYFGLVNNYDTTIVGDTNYHDISLDFETKKYVYDGYEYSASYDSYSYKQNDIYLFAARSGNNVNPYAESYCYEKMSSCKFYSLGTLVYNLIPCYRISDNVIGLYDLVNDVFYTNNGTGDFLKGNNKYFNGSPTYFYPITDLESEYNANLTQTFYLDYNGNNLPSNADFTYTYYTDINCTNAISTSDMVSGNRYYIKAVMVTLTIQGSGTLTSVIVSSAVAKAGSGVTKVVIPSTFTSYEAYCLDSVDTYLNSGLTLETNISISENIYTNITQSSTKFTHLIFDTITSYTGSLPNSKLESIKSNSITTLGSYAFNSSSTLNEIDLPNLVSSGYGSFISLTALTEISLPSMTDTGQNLFQACTSLEKVYMASVTTLQSAWLYQTKVVSSGKCFIGTDNCVFGSTFGAIPYITYFKANKLQDYIVATDWSSVSSRLIGVLDGADTYTDKGFSYPKLSSTLTLDTSNGHLLDNGTDLFSGYTATWYSDEDCTTTISPSAMDTSHTYYVKLTAI